MNWNTWYSCNNRWTSRWFNVNQVVIKRKQEPNLSPPIRKTQMWPNPWKGYTVVIVLQGRKERKKKGWSTQAPLHPSRFLPSQTHSIYLEKEILISWVIHKNKACMSLRYKEAKIVGQFNHESPLVGHVSTYTNHTCYNRCVQCYTLGHSMLS